MVFEWFKRLFKNNQALDSSGQASTQTNEQSSIEFDKESVQLGIAAGYTGRSIHDINSTLNRIETVMPSKDWLTMQLSDHFRNHEESEQRRFETLVNALSSLHSISLEVPEPIKTRLLDKINLAEQNLGLSDRMKELVQLVRYSGEASYKDLTQKMGLTDSGFRSLLSMTMKRTIELEKFERNNKSYLRYRSHEVQSIKQTNAENAENKPTNQEEQQF